VGSYKGGFAGNMKCIHFRKELVLLRKYLFSNYIEIYKARDKSLLFVRDGIE
jgi:hypothetical protein